MSSSISSLIELSQNPQFFQIYSYRYQNLDYINDIKTLRDAWLAQLPGSQPFDLSKATQRLLKILSVPKYDNIETVVAQCSLLESLSDKPDFGKCALILLQSIILSGQGRGREAYLEEYRPAALKILELIESKSHQTDLPTRQLYKAFMVCLDNECNDFELADRIRMLRPNVDLVNLPDAKTTMTPLQSVITKNSDRDLNPKAFHYLLDLGADINKAEPGTTPCIIRAVTHCGFMLEELIGGRADIDITTTDDKGATAYNLMLRRGFSPKLYSQFKHPDEGLPELILSYIDPQKLQELVWFSHPKDHEKHLPQFIEAWKTAQTPQNRVALTQATLTLLFFMEDYPVSIRDEIIELLSCMKGIPAYELLVLNTSHKFKELFSESANLLLNRVMDDLNPDNIPNTLMLDIAIDLLSDPSSNELVDRLLAKKPGILESAKGELARCLEKNNSSAVHYLLTHGYDIKNDPGIIATAASYRNVEIIHALLRHGADINECDSKGNTALHYVCMNKDLDVYDLLMANQNIRADIPNSEGLIPYQVAQRNQYTFLTRQLMGKFGLDQFKSLYEDPYRFYFQNILPTTFESFKALATEELIRINSRGQKGYCFDSGFMQTLSKVHLDFLRKHLAGEVSLEEFPYKEGRINFLPILMEIFRIIQERDDMKSFPAEEIWRYAIDFHREDEGPCAFEDEIGYLNSYLHGLKYALENSTQPKTKDWYLGLHAATTGKTFRPKNGRFDIKATQYNSIPNGSRQMQAGFNIALMDRDPIGCEDLETRPSEQSSWSFNPNTFKIEQNFPNGNMDATLDRIMDQYRYLLTKAATPAERLMAGIWMARELEIHHICADGNGRASVLSLISIVTGDPELPPFLFPDPNVLDGNGPESLAYRYLEGCINFRNGGLSKNYVKKCGEVKYLDALDLTGHEDLIALRESLKPLVQGKRWQEMLDTILIRR